MTESVEALVLGMGPGGEEVAGKLAEAGLQVVAVEGNLVGGECPYWGCVPTKMMVRAAGTLAGAGRVNELAGTSTAIPDWSPVSRRIRAEATDSWSDKVAADRFTGKGGTLIRGWGHVTGPNQVQVGARIFDVTRALVLASGTRPTIPPVAGLSDTPYWTNRDAVAVTELPESLLILGGGAIGVEFAQIFARFGVAVTVVEAADRLLSTEEPETSALLGKVLTAENIRLVIGVAAQRIRHDGKAFTIELADGQRHLSEALLVATGRSADLRELGVAAIGLDPSAKAIPVDERLRVADRTWAVGDITGHGAFTHVAMYQAGIVLRDILGRPGPVADYRALPRVTFTDPEVGAVGLTEAQARKAGVRVKTGAAQVSAGARGWIHKAGNDGFIKLVADLDTGVLVGATSAGPVGGEVLGALSVAIHGQVPLDHLQAMIYAYPTFHRGIEDALRDLMKH